MDSVYSTTNGGATPAPTAEELRAYLDWLDEERARVEMMLEWDAPTRAGLLADVEAFCQERGVTEEQFLARAKLPADLIENLRQGAAVSLGGMCNARSYLEVMKLWPSRKTMVAATV